MNIPLVSIITPAYNAAATIGETVTSVLNSGYASLEMVVVDDGSQDETLSLLRNMEKSDSRLRVFSQPNSGVSVARNHAIRQSRGTYILPLDADDLLVSGFLEWAVGELERHPEMKVIVPRAEFFGQRTGIWHYRRFSLRLLARKNMIPLTALYRRKDYEQTSGYCESMQYREDWEFWISMLERGGGVCVSPMLGFRYRISLDGKRIKDRGFKRIVVETINERHPVFINEQLRGRLRIFRSWSLLFNSLLRVLCPRRLVVAEGFEIYRPFVDALPVIFSTPCGRIIHDLRNQLRILTHGEQEFVVKRFAQPNIINRVAYAFLRQSKAKRSFLYADMLRREGFGSPIPVAYLEQRILGLWFTNSYYVSLRSKLPLTYADLHTDRVDPEEKEKYLLAIGHFTARFHKAGMIHKDYNEGNLLLGMDVQGNVEIELIDLNRIRLRVVGLREGCENMIARLHASPSELEFLAKGYAQERGADVQQCLSWMQEYKKSHNVC